MDKERFKQMFLEMMENRDNPYHPMVWINGDPEIGPETYIGGFSEINASGARVTIGEACDIAAFVVINVSDSHLRAIGLADAPQLRDIEIGDHVFIGSYCAVLGGAMIGHHSVIGAGTIVREGEIPPYSLVVGNPMVVKPGYYEKKYAGVGDVEKT
ncbi:MAG: acyltransferase [Alphaproteobacteria bacterium]|jgi:acetyltransferase-like isoleucine patch superfamily enzyme|nr:acyltransferase [Alphaproteobacteria bacterium]